MITTKRARLNLMGSAMDVLVQLAEGNPGAITALVEMLKAEGDDALMNLLHLDDMNMRGPQIWVLYKDICGQDVAKFSAAILAREQEMVDRVNAICLPQGIEAAVTGHASAFHH